MAFGGELLWVIMGGVLLGSVMHWTGDQVTACIKGLRTR